MDASRKKTIGVVIGIVVLILIIFIIGVILYLLLNRYRSSQFISGYRGSYSDIRDEDLNELVQLYRDNRRLLDETRSRHKVDIRRISDVYKRFLRRCDQSRCYRKIYDNAVEVVRFIESEIEFSNVNTESYRQVRAAMNRMDRLFLEFFDAMKVLNDTVSGSADSRISKILEQFELVDKKDDPYYHLATNTAGLRNEQAEQYINEMKDNQTFFNTHNPWDDSHLLSLTPPASEAVSAYDYLLNEGKERPFSGNVHEINLRRNDSIANAPLEDDTEHGLAIDNRYTRADCVQPFQKNVRTISDYRGRNTSSRDVRTRSCKA